MTAPVDDNKKPTSSTLTTSWNSIKKTSAAAESPTGVPPKAAEAALLVIKADEVLKNLEQAVARSKFRI
jgi:hypothetical protein